MDCLIHLAALCLFDPSNVYVTASVDYALSQDNRRMVWNERATRWQLDRFANSRDHARLEIGWLVPVSGSLTLTIGAAHTSIPSAEDRGYEAAFVAMTWRPFR